MATQAVRNELNGKIKRVITDVKQKIIQEGKKKIHELKDQLLSPEYILSLLTSEINAGSCSLKGRDKFHEIAEKLKLTLTQMEEICAAAGMVFDGLEEKIGAISTEVELPEGAPDPIGAIKTITDGIKPITDTLKYVIMAAPAILASQVSVPGAGGPVSGAVIANTNNGVNLAKVKIKEYVNLFRALPKVIDKYISMANAVFARIKPIQDKINFILGEIQRLKAFIIYLELDFEDKCNQLELPTYPDPDPNPPITTVHPTLEEITALINDLYGNMLDDLIARGDNKAIRRVYKLGAEFQRLENTRVAVVRWDEGTGDYIPLP